MGSPPKPWETNSAGSAGVCPVAGHVAAGTPNPHTTAATPAMPTLPDRPAAMAAAVAAPYASTSAYASPYASRYGGMGAMGGMNSYGSYSSPYSRFGSSFGSPYGQSYGSYGAYGQPAYGGMGAYGMGGMPGMAIGPDGQPISLTQRMEAGTQATFQLLESIVGAFGGFAQMLESTYMATHSSFFAMIGVAEQFASLRSYLGQVLSIFTLIRWIKGLLRRLTGRPELPMDADPSRLGLTPDSFKAFANGQPVEAIPAKPQTPSKKPLIIFFLTVVGLPYLMSKLVRMISAKHDAELIARGAQIGPDGRPLPLPMPNQLQQDLVDPANLTFVRATHPFTTTESHELALNIDDIVAVLTPKSERATAGWWRGRMRDGRIGWFPANYVAELPINTKPKTIDAPSAPQPAVPIPAPFSL